MYTVIYGCVDPRSNELRYVGKTRIKGEATVEQAMQQRLRSHLEIPRRKNHRTNWFLSLREACILPEIFEIETVPTSEWVEAEQFNIQYFRSIGCRLINATDGGEGAPGYKHTEESLAKIRIGRARQGPITSETIAKIVAVNKGKKRSDRIKRKLSEAQQARAKLPPSPAMIAAQKADGDRKRGVSLPDEQKAKMSATQLDRYTDPEEHRKTQEAIAAVRGTVESRDKSSVQMTAMWQDPEIRKKLLSPEAIEKRAVGIRLSRKKPEVIAKMVAAANRLWEEPRRRWTNGTEEKLAVSAPPGWWLGRKPMTDECKEAIRKSQLDRYSDPKAHQQTSDAAYCGWEKRRGNKTT